MPAKKETSDPQDINSQSNPPPKLTVEQFRAADPATRLQMISSLKDRDQEVALLNQLTFQEQSEMLIAGMISGLNSNTAKNQP